MYVVRYRMGDEVTECIAHHGPAVCEIKHVICRAYSDDRISDLSGLDLKIGTDWSVNLQITHAQCYFI